MAFCRILLLSVFILSISSPHITGQTINIMTFNIRLDTPDDGPDQWIYRREHLADIVRYFETDICGMQEVLFHQIVDLENLLPGYTYSGKGRDDGKNGGEFSPVFYKKDRFIYLDGNTFWLSESPDRPSRSWDAALNRIVSWVKLKDKVSGKELFVFNTHFDHIGINARKHSAELLILKIKDIAGDFPVILTGDLNTTHEDEPYRILTRSMSDSRHTSLTKPYGPESTFNGFKNSELENMRIDYILLKEGITVHSFATFSQTWGGRFASDHHPVFIKVILN